MATADFRQRLRDHYQNPDFENPAGAQSRPEDEINMNRFILDYVLDLGPAAPNPNRNDNSPPQGQSLETLQLNRDNDRDIEVEPLSGGTSSTHR